MSPVDLRVNPKSSRTAHPQSYRLDPLPEIVLPAPAKQLLSIYAEETEIRDHPEEVEN